MDAFNASRVETGLPVKLSLVTRKSYAPSDVLGDRNIKHVTAVLGVWRNILSGCNSFDSDSRVAYRVVVGS